jgi:hypothetical protein
MRPGAHPFDHYSASSQPYSHLSPNMSYSSDPSPLGSNGPSTGSETHSLICSATSLPHSGNALSTGAATYSLTCSIWYPSCLEAPLLANDGSDFAFPKPSVGPEQHSTLVAPHIWSSAPTQSMNHVITGIPHIRATFHPPKGIQQSQGVASSSPMAPAQGAQLTNHPASRTRAQSTSTPIKLFDHASTSGYRPASSSPLHQRRRYIHRKGYPRETAPRIDEGGAHAAKDTREFMPLALAKEAHTPRRTPATTCSMKITPIHNPRAPSRSDQIQTHRTQRLFPQPPRLPYRAVRGSRGRNYCRTH